MTQQVKSRLSVFLRVLGNAVVVTILVLGVATLMGGEQRNLAARVDEGVLQAKTNAALSVRNALENRYVAACSLFTPPYPERSIDDLVRCLEEAEALPLSADDGLDVADWLDYNLRKNR